MGNLIKKIMMLVLCVAMVFNSGVYGAKASCSEMDCYVLDIIDDMLIVNSYKNFENITISNGIPITDIENPILTDKKMYFVLDDSGIIGTLVAECIDGEYYSSFSFGVEEEISEAYVQEQAFSLYSYNGCLIMHTATDNQIIENDNFVTLDADNLEYSETLLTKIYEKENLEISSVGKMDDADIGSMLSASSGAYTVTDIHVPYVANGKAVTGVGLCWAASVASISNYRAGTNYTANSLYNKLWTKYSGYGSGDYPVGNFLWINRAWTMCNLEYNYEPNALSGIRISNILSADRPIHMGLFRIDSNGLEHGHGVVLQGIYIGARNFYLLMDPNVKREEVGSVVTVSVSDDVLNNGAHFVYAAGTGTYDDWRRVFY